MVSNYANIINCQSVPNPFYWGSPLTRPFWHSIAQLLQWFGAHGGTINIMDLDNKEHKYVCLYAFQLCIYIYIIYIYHHCIYNYRHVCIRVYIYTVYIYILYIHIRLLMLTPGMAALRNLVFLGLFRCWWCWYFIYVHGNFCMVWGGGGGANSVQSSAFFDSPSCISYSNIQHDLASTLWREERFNTLVMLCCCTSYGNF